jgi:hypothetical protein
MASFYTAHHPVLIAAQHPMMIQHRYKLRGFSPQANYTDRPIAAGQRS